MTGRRSGRTRNPPKSYAAEQAAQAEADAAKRTANKKTTTKRPAEKKTAKKPAPKKTAAKPKAKKTASAKSKPKSANKRKKAEADSDDDDVDAEEDESPKKRSRKDNVKQADDEEVEDDQVDGEQVDPESENENAQNRQIEAEFDDAPPAQHQQPPAQMTVEAETEELPAIPEDAPGPEHPATPVVQPSSRPRETENGTPMLDTPAMTAYQAYMDTRIARPRDEAANDDAISAEEAGSLASAAANAARQSPPHHGPHSLEATGRTLDSLGRFAPRTDGAPRAARETFQSPDADDEDQGAQVQEVSNALKGFYEEEEPVQEVDNAVVEDEVDDDADAQEQRELSPFRYNPDPNEDYVVYTGASIEQEATEEQTGDNPDDSVDLTQELQKLTDAGWGEQDEGATQDEAADEAVNEPEDITDLDFERQLQAEFDADSDGEQDGGTDPAQTMAEEVDDVTAAPSADQDRDSLERDLYQALPEPDGSDDPLAPAAESSQAVKPAPETAEPGQCTEPTPSALPIEPPQAPTPTEPGQPARRTYWVHHSDSTRPPRPFNYYDPNRVPPRHQRSPEDRLKRLETPKTIDRFGREWSPDLSSPEFEEREAKDRERRRAKRAERRQAGASQQRRTVQASQAPPSQPSIAQANVAPQPPSTPEMVIPPVFPEPSSEEIADFDRGDGQTAQNPEVPPLTSPSPPAPMLPLAPESPPSLPPSRTSPPASPPPASASSETFKKPRLRMRQPGSSASSPQNSPTTERSPQSPAGLAHDEGQTREAEQQSTSQRPSSIPRFLQNLGQGTSQGPRRPSQSARHVPGVPRESSVGPPAPVHTQAPQPAAIDPYAEMLAEQDFTNDGEPYVEQPRPQYVPQAGDHRTTLEEEAAAARSTTRPASDDTYCPQPGIGGHFAPQTPANHSGIGGDELPEDEDPPDDEEPPEDEDPLEDENHSVDDDEDLYSS